MGAIIKYETGNHGKGRDLVSFGSVQVWWPSALNILCFEVKEAFEILLALYFYLCNICTQSSQASDPTAAYLLYVFCIAISICCSSGIIRYSDPESIFIHSRLFYFLESTKKIERLQQIQQAFALWSKEQAIKEHFQNSAVCLVERTVELHAY
jgi:hypothetical protein